MEDFKPLSLDIYEGILHLIFSGELSPGQRLREVELVARFGVSRTPIREALSCLSEFGVVEAKHKHGAVVRSLSRETLLIQIHQVREALEGTAAELAGARLTRGDFALLGALADGSADEDAPEFSQVFEEFDSRLHRLVAERSGNPILRHEIEKHLNFARIVNNQLESSLIDERRIERSEWNAIRKKAWREHVEIIAALREGREEECRRTMVDHLRSSCEAKLVLLSRSSPAPDSGARAGDVAASGGRPGPGFPASGSPSGVGVG